MIKIPNKGIINAFVHDSEYPGMSLEFIADGDTGEKASRPRVSLEFDTTQEDMPLVARVWGHSDSEMYTDELRFGKSIEFSGNCTTVEICECCEPKYVYGILQVIGHTAEEIQKEMSSIKTDLHIQYEDENIAWTLDDIFARFPKDWNWRYFNNCEKVYI